MSDIVVHDDAGVREIRIDRPAKRNALTRAMYVAMAEALSGAAAAGNRAVWLHGSAECFTAGNDIGDFAQARPGEPSAGIMFLEGLLDCETPIVASVNGAAVGIGTTMLLHCDLVYCSAQARFQLPFVNLGICPEAASTLLLPAGAGAHLAAELLLLGEPFDAATAHAARIVNAVLPDEAEADAMGRSRAVALAAKAPDALRTTRALLRGGQKDAIRRIMREEAAEFARLLHGPEAREALTAFQEKRPADFTRLAAPAAA
jgi:enoyl-CoA hydratase/carnithine racemase